MNNFCANVCPDKAKDGCPLPMSSEVIRHRAKLVGAYLVDSLAAIGAAKKFEESTAPSLVDELQEGAAAREAVVDICILNHSVKVD